MTAMTMADLACAGVVKSFAGRTVLSNVDLTVTAGTLTAILGESGSGKTTLLRAVMGFEMIDSGSISIGERTLSGDGIHVEPERRDIGYVAQEGALFPHLSVEENVSFGLARAERSSGRRAAEVLEIVGLSSRYARRRPHQLSGGEQRRVALARALAPRPEVVLLDEPFSALDASLRAETRRAVLAALADVGATAVLVTHDQSEALSTGTRVAVLRDGVFAQVSDPRTLYHFPVSVDVGRFVGDAVVLDGDARGTEAATVLGPLPIRPAGGGPADPAAVRGPVHLLLRPEQLVIGTDGAGEAERGDAGATAVVRARVVDVDYRGPDAVIRLSLASPDVQGNGTVLLARTLGAVAPSPGESVTVTVSGTALSYPRLETAQAIKDDSISDAELRNR